VKQGKSLVKIGALTMATVLSAMAIFRVSANPSTSMSFLSGGEQIYSGKGVAKLAGISATQTFVNVPLNWEDAVARIKKEIPTAIERRDGDGPYFVVPQMRNGRVLLTEFPEQSITVRPGRVMRVGARMMVKADSGTEWAHIQIEDYRQPSALESAFNWLGDRLGI
jgi:hypothetical protein